MEIVNYVLSFSSNQLFMDVLNLLGIHNSNSSLLCWGEIC